MAPLQAGAGISRLQREVTTIRPKPVWRTMNPITNVALLVLLDAILLAGWVMIPLGLGGNFVLLGAAFVVAIASGFSMIGWFAIVVLAAAVVAGEVLELLLGALVARRYGASRRGQIGAFVGGIAGGVLGTLMLPIVGSILGSFVGTAAGALTGEIIGGWKRAAGMRAGWGAFLGRVLSAAIKVAIGTGIIVFVVWRTHF